MKKIILSSLIILLAASCSKENELQNLNSLIILDNVYEQAFISCTLKPDSSLINFDRFVDVFIADHQDKFDDIADLNIFFLDQAESVNKFIFEVRVDQDADEKNKIEILNIFNDENLQNEASCETSINLYQGSTLKDFKNNNPKPRLYAEILDCNYSKDSNYGTFRLAIESLINHINKFNIDYQIGYVDKGANQFYWINYYSNKDALSELQEIWLSDREASENIKTEFELNAQCNTSRYYNFFELI